MSTWGHHTLTVGIPETGPLGTSERSFRTPVLGFQTELFRPIQPVVYGLDKPKLTPARLEPPGVWTTEIEPP
jgi:hypothetical protein